MKFFYLIRNNILFAVALFLLAFIPLYPKIPLVNVQNTWVYIRLDDIVVLLSIFVFVILLILKKVSLKTPLTLPIMLFWFIGGISTLHGVLLLFPTLPNIFPNVAFLSYLRRIEYMSLFFIAYASIREKKYINYIVAILVIVLLLVVGYGFGQRFLGFPAYLTMNEEFAKGIPIRLSSSSRVPSTFAGHYDLAGYLVLIIPILVSSAFGFKNWLAKIFLLGSAFLGFALLFMTVSRVSFLVLLISLVLLLIFQRRRLIIISFLALTLLFLILSPMLLERFTSTLSEANVLVDTKTGYSIGQIKMVPPSYFENKKIIKEPHANDSIKFSSSSALFPLSLVPPKAAVVIEPNRPNGESLPQGTSYVNLYLSPVVQKLGMYFYQKADKTSSKSSDMYVVFGDFVVKKAKAYDLSFTTRFQGEWPRTLLAFERNIFLGNGYGSVSLAVDNDYLRALGETGLLGFLSFISIFLVAGIYIKKILSKVDSSLTRGFIVGFMAGTLGLGLNAVFIDVFEASKIAFVYWLLMGMVLGILYHYKESIDLNLYKEFKKIITSSYAVALYLFVVAFALFFPTLNNFFAGDDFTWFTWASNCDPNCYSIPSIIRVFTQAGGFFYRPGTKLYFDFMYKVFWLNQTVYHFVSIFLHFLVAVLLFLISKKIFKNKLLATASAFLFLILSGYSEVVFWIASTGFLFTSLFALLSLLSFIYWRESRKEIFFTFSIVFMILSPIFHELGIITPLFVILYDAVTGGKALKNFLSEWIRYAIVLLPVFSYLFLRLIAQSHWFNGDYSYNFVKLPYNFLGNIIGYLTLIVFGASSLSFYEKLRIFSRDHLTFAFSGSLITIFLFVMILRIVIRKMETEDKRIVIFGFLFFILSLLPFLGLGNITSRYSYLASFGVIILLVYFLKRIYIFFLDNGKNVALLGIAVIIIIFSSVHLFQTQKIQRDWLNAGEKSKNFLTSLNYIYAHYSETDTTRLYFVNTPIRTGEAWVFPTGLPDATWLMFHNENIKVYQVGSVEQAFSMKDGLPGRVFEFDNKGNLIEKIKMLNGEIISVNR